MASSEINASDIEAYKRLKYVIFEHAIDVNAARGDDVIIECLDFDIDADDLIFVRYEYEGYSGDNWTQEAEAYCSFPLDYLYNDDWIDEIKQKVLADNIARVEEKRKEDAEKTTWDKEMRRREYYELRKEFGNE